jgi:hypothetical protein
MANEVQNGTGLIHGIANNGSAITLEGYATFLLETAKAGHKFKLDSIEDELGFDATLIATNGHVETTINWTPSGATRAAAAATAAFLTPLATVTLANFKVAAFNGDWIYVGDQSIDLSHGVGKMSLKLRKYDDSTQNTSLTTTVTG